MQQPHVIGRRLGESLWLVELIGEHDLSTRDAVLAELEHVHDAGANVIVDLSDTDFIDSSVLSVLVAAHKRAEWTPGKTFAVVVCPGTAPERLFDLTNARTYFATFASRHGAMQWCGVAESGVAIPAP